MWLPAYSLRRPLRRRWQGAHKVRPCNFNHQVDLIVHCNKYANCAGSMPVGQLTPNRIPVPPWGNPRGGPRVCDGDRRVAARQGTHKGRPYKCNVITDMAVRYAKCVHNDGWTFHPNPPQLSRIHPNLTGTYTVVGATLVVAQVFRCGDRRVLEGRAPTRDAPTIVNFRGIRRVLRLSFSYDGRETLEHLSTGFTHIRP